MTERTVVKMPKWPFILIDLLFLGLAGWIIYSRSGPIAHVLDSLPLIVCVAAGAGFLAYPFIMDYKAAVKLAETENLTTAVSQVQNIEAVASQISTATGHWQSAIDQSKNTVTAAQEIAERMTAEAKAFAEFMQQANEKEKAHFRFEAEKLHRAQREWLEVVVRMLDHIYELYLAAVQSGQPNLVRELTRFQNACRDAARRVGLAVYVPNANDAFDPERHELRDGKSQAEAGAIVGLAVAPGYSFQGQLVRKALVDLQTPNTLQEVASPPNVEAPTEGQLL